MTWIRIWIFFQCGSKIRVRIRNKIKWILSTDLMSYCLQPPPHILKKSLWFQVEAESRKHDNKFCAGHYLYKVLGIKNISLIVNMLILVLYYDKYFFPIFFFNFPILCPMGHALNNF